MNVNEFFTNIYSWFCDKSQDVFKIMDVITNDDEDVLLSSAFPTIGFTVVAISLLIALAFYIWPLNHPRFKAWWAWLITLAANAAINFGLAFAFINHRINDIKKLGWDDLDNVDVTLSLPSSQWIDFAWANLCVSIIFFVVAGLLLNWFSTNCRFSPFRS